MKKFLKWLKSPSSDFVLFIFLLILANIAAHNAYIRFDLTGPKSYSLSNASKSIVKNIEEPLNVRVFFADNLPSPYNGVAQYVKDILVEYKSAANRNFSVNYMDMSKPENEQMAAEYGLHQIQIKEVKNNEVGFKQVFMGIVVSYGDNIEVLDAITSSDGFEYTLTTKISKMISTADTLAAFNSSEKITVTLYMSSQLKNFRINGTDKAEKVLKAAVQNVNKKYMDRIDFNVVNPVGGEVTELIEKYGLPRLNVQNANGKTDVAVFGAVMEFGEKFTLLPVQIQRSLFGHVVAGLEEAEENIAGSIESLLSKTTKVGYITGHNEVSRQANQNQFGQQDMDNAANFEKLISDMYELIDIDLTKDVIPVDMKSVIVNGPKGDFTEAELYKLDQFVMNGGNILMFVDGLAAGQQDYYGNVSYVPNQLNIDTLLQKYGVKRGLNIVMDKNCYSQGHQQYGKLNLYWAPVLQKNCLAKKNPITNNLGYVIMLQNGSLDVSDAIANKNLKTTVLAKSSADSWVLDKNIQLNPLALNPPADAKARKSENLAVLMEGKFTSAFDKAPVIEDQNSENTNDGFEADSHIKSGIQNSKIVVVSSSAVTTGQVIDTEASNPIAMMLLNAVDYLNGNEDLCTMRTKGLSLNTLTLKNKALSNLMKYFNQYGLVVLVLFAGFIVWRRRTARRKQINEKYNPNDERIIK